MHIYINSTWTHVPQSIGQTEDKLFCCPSVTAILVQRDRFSPGAPQGSTGSWYPLHDSVVVVVVIVVAVVDVSVPVVVVPVVNVSVVVVDVVVRVVVVVVVTVVMVVDVVVIVVDVDDLVVVVVVDSDVVVEEMVVVLVVHESQSTGHKFRTSWPKGSGARQLLSVNLLQPSGSTEPLQL